MDRNMGETRKFFVESELKEIKILLLSDWTIKYINHFNGRRYVTELENDGRLLEEDGRSLIFFFDGPFPITVSTLESQNFLRKLDEWGF